MEYKINILLVDDHQIFRDGLKLLLSHFPFVGEITEASNGKEALNIIDTKKPDIVFMDIEMPIMSGIEATKQALIKYPELKIIVVTTFKDENYLEQMMNMDVAGYMLKRSTRQEFEEAIKKVYSGGSYFSDEILNILTLNLNKSKRNLYSSKQTIQFTARESEILGLICKGFNNEQIAEMIYVSPKTVEKHKSSLFLKTGTKNAVNLIIYAIKNGLINVEDLPE